MPSNKFLVSQKRKGAFFTLLCTWLSTASANGFNRLPSNTTYVQRFWLLIILAAYAALTYHAYTLFSSYLEYPVSNQLLLQQAKVEMPDVTICRSGIFHDTKTSLPKNLTYSSQRIWEYPYNENKKIDKLRYKLEDFQRGAIFEDFHQYSSQLPEYLMLCTYQVLCHQSNNFST